ncbi:hypothetical protein [Paractinoplanes globisporus]|uniref:Uncharacterized protein n=1 Tax=Paractinoplanes globisporus TaxID=113565 RepID=A0ABW6WMG6_9ACTN|nr:hypothetical protein [Actinoplanes globisporus]
MAQNFPDDIKLSAFPGDVTAGGIVLLVAETGDLEGEWDVTWTVEGPVVLSDRQAEVALLGAASVERGPIDFEDQGTGPEELRATLDTRPLTVGSWTVVVDFANGPENDRTHRFGRTHIQVRQTPFAAGDDVSVTLRRAAVQPTPDQALWVSIRNSTNNLGFERYTDFMDRVLCESDRRGRRLRQAGKEARRVLDRTALPFPHVERYRLLKAATEVFLMINCRTDLDDFGGVDLDAESARLNRTVTAGELEQQFRSYLVETPTGDGGELEVLPYLGLVRRKLGDVPVVGGDDAATALCYGILAEKLTHPCFLELIWSYWMERGGLTRAIDAITWRFQNRPTGYAGRDPLGGLDIDPLRPLNNLLWGYQRDEQHRLTPEQRNDEYAHGYGVQLAQPSRRVADNRSRFMSAFHHLLGECMEFYDRDDNTVVIANGFDVLNGLKETHLLLTQGAHNQYGDLPWTARHEMLMSQWILGLPEVRDFLPSRIMVDSPEAWMDAVDGMNRLQGWSDVSVLHYRDLAVFGEQLLLSIRYGDWPSVSDADRAANWARYFRQEVQQYCHSKRAVAEQGTSHRGSPRSLNGYGRRPAYQAYRG